MPFNELSNFKDYQGRESRMARRFAIITAMMSLARRSRNHGACPVCSSKMADVEDEVFYNLIVLIIFYASTLTARRILNHRNIIECFGYFLGVRSFRNYGLYNFIRVGKVS